jgi:pyruvate formate lyase activating enzyme
MHGQKEPKGCVFDIVKYMVEDGPGIRTCIFFKGCRLRCRWCSNALGLEPGPRIVYLENKCLGCRECVIACPNGAISADERGGLMTDPSKCTACGKCSEVCPAKARQLIGKEYTVQGLIDIVERDRVFYRRQGGGVTATGGEVLMQAGFVYRFLKRCKEHLLGTAIETSAFGSWELLEPILAVTDFAFVDLKHFVSPAHFRLTGVGNELILENITRASKFCLSHSTKLIIRIPIIPEVNDFPDDLIKTADFVKNLPGIRPEVNLLPYHRYGIPKYSWLGKGYELKEVAVPSDQQMQTKRKIFIERGLTCTVGGSEVSSY